MWGTRFTSWAFPRRTGRQVLLRGRASVNGPASTGRKDPLKAGECGHCHCYSYYTDQGATERKPCCWCLNISSH